MWFCFFLSIIGALVFEGEESQSIEQGLDACEDNWKIISTYREYIGLRILGMNLNLH